MSEPAVRRGLPADAEAVTRLIERAIRISTTGVYPAEAVEAWATGSTAEAVRAMIEVTDGFVATAGKAVVGWPTSTATRSTSSTSTLTPEDKVSPGGCTRPSKHWLEPTASTS